MMKKVSMTSSGLVFVAGLALLCPAAARAHCDTMDGPVVAAAREALKTGNVNLVLIWVQPGDEAAVHKEFDKTLAAHKAGGAQKETGGQRFFETLVRIHRAGEGEPYTGIKPAGTEIDPAVRAADKALETGSVEPVQKLLSEAVQAGVQKYFGAAMDRRSYDPNDVPSGREYVKAYVEYTHYVEGLHQAATGSKVHHEHGETEPHGGEHAGHDQKHGDGGDHDQDHTGHLPWIVAGLLGLLLIGENSWIVLRRKRGA